MLLLCNCVVMQGIWGSTGNEGKEKRSWWIFMSTTTKPDDGRVNKPRSEARQTAHQNHTHKPKPKLYDKAPKTEHKNLKLYASEMCGLAHSGINVPFFLFYLQFAKFTKNFCIMRLIYAHSASYGAITRVFELLITHFEVAFEILAWQSGQRCFLASKTSSHSKRRARACHWNFLHCVFEFHGRSPHALVINVL